MWGKHKKFFKLETIKFHFLKYKKKNYFLEKIKNFLILALESSISWNITHFFLFGKMQEFLSKWDFPVIFYFSSVDWKVNQVALKSTNWIMPKNRVSTKPVYNERKITILIIIFLHFEFFINTYWLFTGLSENSSLVLHYLISNNSRIISFLESILLRLLSYDQLEYKNYSSKIFLGNIYT